MRRKLVAGNWKMNGSTALVDEFISALGKASLLRADLDVVLAPPAVYLTPLNDQLSGSGIQLSAQNVSSFTSGAYTGEIAAEMLADIGCKWCIVGHSERRALFQEADEIVAEKVAQLLSADVKPILCVGETLEEREAGKAEEIVVNQINVVFDRFETSELKNLVVAYEPVWAIGTGKTATPEQAQHMHSIIRDRIGELSPELANNMPLLYGGSVNAENAEALFAQEDIDGGLVGGASLKVKDFLRICESMG